MAALGTDRKTVFRCKKHKAYKAVFPPRVNCRGCWLVYALVAPYDKVKDLIDVVTIYQIADCKGEEKSEA